MSGYELNDFVDVNNTSDEELEDRPLKGKMEVGCKLFTVGVYGKINLEKGKVFKTVSSFRLELKDYIIQKGV